MNRVYSCCWRLIIAILGFSSIFFAPQSARADGPTIAPDPRFGIDFVSAPGQTYSDQARRYASAAQAGASWNRWPLYWSNLENNCNHNYAWSQADSVVSADVAQNLSIDAILIGTPQCYATTTPNTSVLPPDTTLHQGISTLATDSRSPPMGLSARVFADGTDTWAPGKAINQQNPWALFVNATVARYHNQIHEWEIWNEPDNSGFWTGTISDYYRLLQVGYLAAHAADPSARILVGGMMYWQWTNAYGDHAWLKQFLATATADPTSPSNGYFFDVIPWHFYSRSSDVRTKLTSAKQILDSYHVAGKELWLNETNVPACDDHFLVNGVDRFVACNSGSPIPQGFGTITEQASFIIQAISNAFVAGATRVFQFQMEDDGNGEAFGMFRNDQSMRPIYSAFQLTLKYIKGFTNVQRSVSNGAEFVTFTVFAAPPRRVTISWNDTGQPLLATIPAASCRSASVQLIQQDGSSQSLAPAQSYAVNLAPATNNRNYDTPWNPNDYTIGGLTTLLVENVAPPTTPPATSVSPLPPVSSPFGFTLSWTTVSPGMTVIDYTIQFRDMTIGGAWTSLETNTTDTSTFFTPIAGHTYQFRSLGRDCAGTTESKGTDQFDTTTSSSGTIYKTDLPLILDR